MATFITVGGKQYVLWADNVEDKTVDLIPAEHCDKAGRYDVESMITYEYQYSDIDMVDGLYYHKYRD